MNGYIQKIKTVIPNSKKNIEIDVKGRNIIFTGGNGCGKTQLIDFLYEILERRIINKENETKEKLNDMMLYYEEEIRARGKAHPSYDFFSEQIIKHRKELNEIENPAILINDANDFIINYHEEKAVCLKFNATRQAKIEASKSSVSKDDLIRKSKQTTNSEVSFFEDYLVSQKTAQAYADSPSIGNNPDEANRIKKWFDKLESDFRELFEDESLSLLFVPKSQSFLIKQENKEPYRLQQLSSGFSSIISVYADLFMKIELRSILPSEVRGIAFIDEIDAHLHVSLQRKIFSFLVKSFPKIQFIVSTHSPFVVSSVSDAVIYDLSRIEQVEDLSMYSYEAVLEGLFGVLPVSEILEDKILQISKLSSDANPDLKLLLELVSQVGEHENKLDEESAFFLKKAKIILKKEKTKEGV